MESNNEWLVSQLPPEYKPGDGRSTTSSAANHNREVQKAPVEFNPHTEIIRRGLAEIALRVQSGRTEFWQDLALCSAPIVDRTIFEPARKDAEGLKVARQYCNSCDVFEQCDRFSKGQKGGGMVWAGKRKE